MNILMFEEHEPLFFMRAFHMRKFMTDFLYKIIFFIHSIHNGDQNRIEQFRTLGFHNGNINKFFNLD